MSLLRLSRVRMVVRGVVEHVRVESRVVCKRRDLLMWLLLLLLSVEATSSAAAVVVVYSLWSSV